MLFMSGDMNLISNLQIILLFYYDLHNSFESGEGRDLAF